MAFLTGAGGCPPDVSGPRSGAATASSAAGWVGAGWLVGSARTARATSTRRWWLFRLYRRSISKARAGGACPCMAPPPPIAARLARPRMHQWHCGHGSLQSNAHVPVAGCREVRPADPARGSGRGSRPPWAVASGQRRCEVSTRSNTQRPPSAPAGMSVLPACSTSSADRTSQNVSAETSTMRAVRARGSRFC